MNFSKHIKNRINLTIKTNILIATNLSEKISQIGKIMINSLLNGKKILTCGSSASSAALSQYFSSKLLNRFEISRPELPAISLSSNSTMLTSISHDDGYTKIFSKQIQALGKKGDILVCLCTNGNSISIIEAIKKAKKKNILSICIKGKKYKKLKKNYKKCDIEICIPSNNISCLQENQLTILNCLCDIIDKGLFGK